MNDAQRTAHAAHELSRAETEDYETRNAGHQRRADLIVGLLLDLHRRLDRIEGIQS